MKGPLHFIQFGVAGIGFSFLIHNDCKGAAISFAISIVAGIIREYFES